MNKFPQVQNFLYFFKLEKGGIFIGCVKLVAGVLFMITTATFFGISVSSALSHDNHLNATNDSSGPTEKISSDDHLKALTSCVGMLISFWVIYAAWELIQGSLQRKSEKLKPILVLCLGSIVVNASLMVHGIPGCVVPTVIQLYNLLVIYSLFRKIKIKGKKPIEPVDAALPMFQPPTNEHLSSSAPNNVGWVLRDS